MKALNQFTECPMTGPVNARSTRGAGNLRRHGGGRCLRSGGSAERRKLRWGDHGGGLPTRRYGWDGNTNGLELSFLRGLDLSGTLQGAGGVGGLLAVTHHGSLVTTHFAACDGNGNVAALVDAADGTESARYEYGPFGEPLRITGAMGKVNPIRFSTQYADDWTGDLKYLHRDYRPDLGRWLNRDPIGERGARLLEKYGAARASDRFDSLAGKRSGRSPVRREEFNLYAFVENAPTIYIDIDGRQAAPGGGKGALPNVSYPAQPIGCSLTCCDDDKIEEGRRTLRRRYLQAVQAATALGLTPVNPPKQGATCKNSSLDFINWLLPYPPCWYCYLEERDYTANDPNDQGFDHQVIICNAYGSLGSIKKQIMFDWWGQTTWNKPYGDENPTSVTGGTYHSPNQQTSPKHFIDCQGVTHGKPQPKDFNSCTAKE